MKPCIPCGGNGRPQAIIQYHDGKSAYELALENGFVGTEIEYLASLKGEKGDKGERGEIGPDGKSAYQVWLNTGKTGTESEFLMDIRGQKGAKGDAGKNGEANTITNITATVTNI